MRKVTCMSDIVSEITAQRGSVYGEFLHNAIVSQKIKLAMRGIPDPDNDGLRWENLPFDVRESLDLIALKISRIITGDHNHIDNWDDIGGYARIVADRIRRSNVSCETSSNRVPASPSTEDAEHERAGA
jgi:hypothetical protein